MEYATRWRLQQAATLLTQRGVSVATAAAAVGYESEAAFNRAFKKFVGVPPGTWRKHRLHGRVSGSMALPEHADGGGA